MSRAPQGTTTQANQGRQLASTSVRTVRTTMHAGAGRSKGASGPGDQVSRHPHQSLGQDVLAGMACPTQDHFISIHIHPSTRSSFLQPRQPARQFIRPSKSPLLDAFLSPSLPWTHSIHSSTHPTFKPSSTLIPHRPERPTDPSRVPTSSRAARVPLPSVPVFSTSSEFCCPLVVPPPRATTATWVFSPSTMQHTAQAGSLPPAPCRCRPSPPPLCTRYTTHPRPCQSLLGILRPPLHSSPAPPPPTPPAYIAQRTTIPALASAASPRPAPRSRPILFPTRSQQPCH